MDAQQYQDSEMAGSAKQPNPTRRRRKQEMTPSGKVPAFVASLWSIMNDPRYSHIIHWNAAGRRLGLGTPSSPSHAPDADAPMP
jgi:hypothetical protein